MSQGPVFAAPFSAIASTGEADVFEIVAPSSGRVRILGISLTQHSEAGDAASELLPVRILRGSTASGGAGSTITPVNLGCGTRVAETSVIGLSTGSSGALGSTASTTVVHSESFNVQAGFIYNPKVGPDFDSSVWLSTGQRALVRVGTPADSVTFNGTLLFQEMPK